MDGYAVREADLPGTLRVIGESFAGGGFDGRAGAGDLRPHLHRRSGARGRGSGRHPGGGGREGDAVAFAGSRHAARYIRLRGSDFAAGDVAARGGRRLDPRALVAAAGADVAEVEAWRRPGRAGARHRRRAGAAGRGAAAAPARFPRASRSGVAALVELWGGRQPRLAPPRRRSAGRWSRRPARRSSRRTWSSSPAAPRSARRISPRRCSRRTGST